MSVYAAIAIQGNTRPLCTVAMLGAVMLLLQYMLCPWCTTAGLWCCPLCVHGVRQRGGVCCVHGVVLLLSMVQYNVVVCPWCCPRPCCVHGVRQRGGVCM